MAKTLSAPDDILEAALKKEKVAFRFYNNLLQGTHVDFVRDLLEQLRDEEAKHVRMIEKKIAAMEAGRG